MVLLVVVRRGSVVTMGLYHRTYLGHRGYEMGNVTLSDAWTKLARAREHLNELSVDIDEFWSASAHRVDVEKDLENLTYRFRLVEIEPVRQRWSVLVGDCVHNARASLDYLMAGLVAVARGVNPLEVSDAAFPIYFEEPGKVPSAEKRFNGDGGVKVLREFAGLHGYMNRIKELQPFNNANPSIWGEQEVDAFGAIIPGYLVENGDGGYRLEMPKSAPAYSPLPDGLQQLAVLDNTDKHRGLVRLNFGLISHRTTGAVTYESLHEDFAPPVGFDIRTLSRTNESVSEGSVLGDITFRDPVNGSWTPTSAELRGVFPLAVVVEEVQPFDSRTLIDDLERSLWSAAAVLRIFEPAFEQPRRPPHPITSVMK